MAEEGGYIPLPSSDQAHMSNLLRFDTFDHTPALTAPQQKDWLRIDAHGNLELAKASSGRRGLELAWMKKHDDSDLTPPSRWTNTPWWQIWESTIVTFALLTPW